MTTKSKTAKVCTTTEDGKKRLGKFAREAREAMGWSMRDVAAELERLTGFTITSSAISDLENGNREPQWNTLAKIVALRYIKNPRTESPYEVSDLFKIACEALDPYTGEIRKLEVCNPPN